jgi:peptide/nickel transport system permease protein
MLRYILKRLLIFIPTLLVISLLTFAISVNAPGDPIDQMINKNAGDDAGAADKIAGEKVYRETSHLYGFDLPLFYFSISNRSVPDTLYKIANQGHRSMLERLSSHYGNWPRVSEYYLRLRAFESQLYSIPLPARNSDTLLQAKNTVTSLFDTYSEAKIRMLLSSLDLNTGHASAFPHLSQSLQDLEKAFQALQAHRNTLNRYLPALHWYGFNNQYHRWLSRFVRGDFGISYQDKRPVSSVIRDAWPWTAGISLLSVLLAYLISIPLGIRSATGRGLLSEKTTSTTLFVLYSLPNFWVATLLLIFFCGGDWFHLFPGPGAEPIPADAPLVYAIGQVAWRLVLPLICWTYGSLAFISRQMRGGMLQELQQDYIRTARAKGLDEHTVVWKHALKNSVLPVITLFASVFPLVLSGSVVLEHIFNIPGMGQLTYEALFAKNYPVIFTVLLLSAFLTLLGNLVADLLYAWADPRISFTGQKI